MHTDTLATVRITQAGKPQLVALLASRPAEQGVGGTLSFTSSEARAA